MVKKDKNNKSIYEMENDELKSNKKSNKSEIDALSTEIANNTVKTVFGLSEDAKMYYDGEETTINDFMETETFEQIVKDGANNYGVLCSQLFTDDPKKPINNKNLETVLKNIKVSRSVFWKIIWKSIKREYLLNKNEKIQRILSQRTERDGEKMEDSE